MFPSGFVSSMPEVLCDAREAYGYGEVRVRITPSAQEIDEMDRIFAWLLEVPEVDRRMLSELGRGDSYRTIGRHHRFSHEWIRKMMEPWLVRLSDFLHLRAPDRAAREIEAGEKIEGAS